MTHNTHVNSVTRKTRVTGLASALALVLAMPAAAVEFENGEWSGNFDTSVSYGASWRTTSSKAEDNAKAVNNPAVSLLPFEQQVATIGRWSNNDDDPNLNYPDSGDLITNVAIITAELDVTWRNFGGFFRASGFYDFHNEGKPFLSDVANDRVGKDVRLLDAYIYGDHWVGERFLNWRLGQQVVSWGESTFIQGGLNIINPVDVSKLRLAGSELKEAFEGVNMIRGSIDLTPSLSLEAFYLFEWEPIIPDPAGTYYSSSDIATPGASYAMLNFGLVPQPVINPDLYRTVCLEGNLAATDSPLGPAGAAAGCRVAVPRGADVTPSDSGQFGFALRYFAENLNSTEFGFYYLRYHSRLPLISGSAVVTNPFVPPFFASASYWTEYPEDIDLYGVSFNTTVGTWSLGGEISYRPDVPLQIDDVEILFGALTPLNALVPEPVLRFQSQLGEFDTGEYIQGYHENSMYQAQATLTKLFGPGNFLKANQIVFVSEFGLNYVSDLHPKHVLRFNGSGTDTGGGPDRTTGNFRNPVTEPTGFADDFSWGYRVLARADYNNAIGAWTVSPSVAWSHDVDGTTPGPGGAFEDGRKILTTAVSFNLLNEWVVDLSWTNYMGGGKYHLLRNRDFFAASVRYSF